MDGAPVEAPPRGRRPLTLRARLVLAILALLALVVVLVGTASGVLLRGVLVGQLDTELVSSSDRAVRAILGDGPKPPQVWSQTPAPEGPLVDGGGSTTLDDPADDGASDGPAADDWDVVSIPGQAVGTVVLVVVDGTAGLRGRLGPDGSTLALTDAEVASLTGVIDHVGTIVTTHVGELGAYRVLVRQLGTGTALAIGVPLAGVDATVAQLWAIAAGVGALALGGAAALGALIVRVALRPLDRVVATASEVSDLPLDRDAALAVRVPDSDADDRTEVGRVGASINRMLDHVADALTSREESERRLRRFVADASHELRTPLASIRGYSELTRRSGEPVPEPVAHALGRIESESVRMTGLVEDLLLLARLDEARSIESAPVDLTELLVTAVSDAQVAGGDHEWEVDVPDEPVVVTGDAARLHQVAMNLLTNARRHTPAGTRVVARLRNDGPSVLLEVEDDGPGIDPELLPNVFGRFVRGDASRARATGSTGLGLAIVHAVAAAHGGSAEAVSAPGRTVFSVRLPAAG